MHCWTRSAEQVARVGNKLICAKSGESKFFITFKLLIQPDDFEETWVMCPRYLLLQSQNSNDKFNVISLGGHDEINRFGQMSKGISML